MLILRAPAERVPEGASAGQPAVIAIRADRSRLWTVLGLLVLLHFAVRPRLGYPAIAPDFLLLALMLYAIPQPAGGGGRGGLGWWGSWRTP